MPREIAPSMRRLTITEDAPAFFLLLNNDGVWVGPGTGSFRTSQDARTWARKNGYSVARQINRRLQ